MITKKCTKCGKVKNINEFIQHKSYKDGYTTQCKCCISDNKKNNYRYNKNKNIKLNKDINADEVTKKCNICGEVKLLSEFYKNIGNKDGHTNECICCMKLKQKSRIKQLTSDEKAKRAEYHRMYRLKKKQQQLKDDNIMIYI